MQNCSQAFAVSHDKPDAKGLFYSEHSMNLFQDLLFSVFSRASSIDWKLGIPQGSSKKDRSSFMMFSASSEKGIDIFLS